MQRFLISIIIIIDIRKYSFSSRIVNIWNSLPDQVVDVSSIDLFKARLDNFWSCQDDDDDDDDDERMCFNVA